MDITEVKMTVIEVVLINLLFVWVDIVSEYDLPIMFFQREPDQTDTRKEFRCASRRGAEARRRDCVSVEPSNILLDARMIPRETPRPKAGCKR